MHTKKHTHSFPSCRYTSIWICSSWPAGWKVSFSHWELCQFSFHYPTWGLNPHYHNKLYFYRHVQTEAAFQGIRLNFTWPPVFLGNTVLPQLPPPSPKVFFFFSYGTCCSQNIKSPLILYIVIPKLNRLIPFVCLSERSHCSSYCAANWIFSYCGYTHHPSFHLNLPKGTCQRLLYQIISKNLVGNTYQVLFDNTARHHTWQQVPLWLQE